MCKRYCAISVTLLTLLTFFFSTSYAKLFGDVGVFFEKATGVPVPDTPKPIQEPLNGAKDLTRKALNEALRFGDDLGEAFAEFICSLVGKHPKNDGCNVNIEASTDQFPKSDSDKNEINYYYLDATWYDGGQKYVPKEEIQKGIRAFYNKPIWPGQSLSFKIFPPNKTGEIRNDNVGQGYFGAPRSNGHGYHRGVDYLSKLGDPVIAPVSGIVERITRPYKDPVKNKHLQGIVIKNSVSRDFETVVFYVDPNKSLKKGSVVIAGQTELGKAQSMMFIHNGAKDHIHVEIHGPNNIVVPPAPNTTVK